MNALILSCSTGGGHNSAAYALKETIERRGHNVVVMDPYELTKKHVDRTVGNAYISMVRNAQWAFGTLYYLGEAYRRLPLHSPVYLVNKSMIKQMSQYLEEHVYDIIFVTHLFPSEILAAVKDNGTRLPPVILIATDYACVPFEEEGYCDFGVVASPKLIDEFTSHGFNAEKILPLGIPVRKAFSETADREETTKRLELDPKRRYLLLMGGSFGAGRISDAAEKLQAFLRDYREYTLIIVCGSDEKLYEKLDAKYGENDQILLLHSTEHPEDYLRISDLLITKPGGMLSTEAAVEGTPIIHISPIHGVEPKNMAYFSGQGMSVNVGNHMNHLVAAVEELLKPENIQRMKEAQKRESRPNAADDICEFAEEYLSCNVDPYPLLVDELAE